MGQVFDLLIVQMQEGRTMKRGRSRGQVIDLFTKKSKTCPSDL